MATLLRHFQKNWVRQSDDLFFRFSAFGSDKEFDVDGIGMPDRNAVFKTTELKSQN
jgi:hypothetical protein